MSNSKFLFMNFRLIKKKLLYTLQISYVPNCKFIDYQYITVLVLRNQHQNVGTGKSVRRGFANQAQNFNAGFVKLALYNVFFYIILFFLINTKKPNIEKKN